MKQYLELLQDILDSGVDKGDRTGTGTRSVFGRQLRHDLSDGFPLLTTKKLHFRSIANELLWFLSGDTNIAWLREQGVSIWNEWATDAGELGPIYGRQWTAWPTRDGGSINQIDYVIDCLRHNPDSRRILFHGWNVEYLPDESLSPQENVRRGRMALPPCHLLYQFYVAQGRLSTQLFIRSSDTFLGLPYNIASVALLQRDEQLIADAAQLVGSSGDDLLAGVQRKLAEIKALQSEVKALRTQLAMGRAAELAAIAHDGVVVTQVDQLDPGELRELAIAVRQQPSVHTVVLVGETPSGGVALVAAVPKESEQPASNLLKGAAKAVGGGGGGKGDIATAGGKDPSGIQEALQIAAGAVADFR